MTSNPALDAAAVEQAVTRLAAIRPAYTSILGFYGPVFLAQFEAATHTCPAAIQIDPSLLEMKSKAGFALIEPVAFTLDIPAAEKLLVQICRIAATSGEKLAGAGQALAQAMDDGERVETLFSGVLDDSGHLQTFADRLSLPADALTLLLYLAIKPSLEAGARQLVVQLAHALANDWEHPSSCPICGSAPIIGELDTEGKQWVHCGLCWHRWPVKRLACPFCKKRDPDSLEYIYSDDEPEYRVSLCGSCKRCLKVVDTRKMERGFYAPLEQVASLHLDMVAAEKGFAPMVHLQSSGWRVSGSGASIPGT